MKTAPAPTPDMIAAVLRHRLAEHERQESQARLTWARTTLLPMIKALAPGVLQRVLVFGSSGSGSAAAHSDIDVLITAEAVDGWDQYERLQWGARVRAVLGQSATGRRYPATVNQKLYGEALEWMAEAKHDLLTARSLLEIRSFAWACFASQQAAEKAFKAVLIALDNPGVHRHAITDLAESVQGLMGGPLPEIVQAASGLDLFYIASLS